MNKDVLCSDCPARWPDTRLRAVPDAEPRERAGTVAHFEGNGPSVTGVIWVNQPKPSPGTAVYLSPARPSFDAGLALDEFDDYCRNKIGNCSDRHCMLGHNAVGTNGGCRCWDDRNKMRRYLPASRQLLNKIRALKAAPGGGSKFCISQAWVDKNCNDPDAPAGPDTIP